MPAVAAPATVLVTGATGYIAAHVVKVFIDAGFTVIGTVRRAAGGEYLQCLFPERFSFVIVGDIQTVGALDELATRVDVIVHTASPVSYPPGEFDPQLLIGPAVDGTRNILNSAAVVGSKVQRVVITGSVVSLNEPHEGPYVYSDKDWNAHAVKVVEDLGHKAPQQLKYEASKVLAEHAVVDYIAQNKPAFDVVNILPHCVYGPIISDVKNLEAIPRSINILLETMARPDLHSDPEASAGAFIDVRDVARMHLDAATRPELAGARIIGVHETPLAFQDFYDVYHRLPESARPKLPKPYVVPIGRPGAGDAQRNTFPRFARDSQQKLGWLLIGLYDSVHDTLQSLVNKGCLELD